MKKKGVIVSMIGLFVFILMIAGVNAASLKYSNPTWVVANNGVQSTSFNNEYTNVITDFQPSFILPLYTKKTRYVTSLYVGGSYVPKQTQTYNIAANASGYFNMGYVGAGNVLVQDYANDSYGTTYAGWGGLQQFWGV